MRLGASRLEQMAVIDTPGVAWVTGASSGIGRALCLALSGRGWTVVASARRAPLLAALAEAAHGPGRIIAAAVDTTDPEAVAATVNRIVDEHGPIDLAILNAGTHIPTPVSDFDLEAIRHLVDVNLIGTANCLAALLPRFMARRAGEIAVVASLTGYRGLPTASAYGATKAALINMCESLRPELELHDVSLRLVNPGFIDTPLTRLNRFPMPFLIPAEAGADAILRRLRSRRFEITVPRRMAPNWLFLAIARRITPTPADPGSDRSFVERTETH